MVPFVIQTMTAVGITGWLSIRNGQRAINEVVGKYQQELVSHVERQLAVSLTIPHHINHLNADAMRSGYIDITDPDSLERYFWQQLRNHPSVSYIYAGSPDGGIIGVGQLSGDRYRSFRTEQFRAGRFFLFDTSRNGDRRTPILAASDESFDARDRPWYRAAVEAQQPVWSSIYTYAGEGILGISASYPLYDRSDDLRGIFAVDLALEQISTFLKTYHANREGQTFIVERSGYLVASSTPEAPFIQQFPDASQERRHISQSSQPTLQGVADYLDQSDDKLGDIRAGVSTDLPLQGDRHFLHIMPFQDGHGLDWLIIVVVPESAFMRQIHDNTRQTIFLCIAALGVALIIGSLTSKWITQPISKLSDASRAIAEGDLTQTVSLDREDELGVLGQSFNRMATQLRHSFQLLEDRVNERTRHLVETNRQLEAEIEERKRVEDQLTTSEQKYRTLFDGSPDAVMLFDGHTFIDCNTATLAMFRCETKEQFCCKHPLDFSPPNQPNGEASKSIGATYVAIAQQRGSYQFEWIHQRLDGQPFWAEVWLSAINLGGETVLQAVIRDITQRKRVEEALRESEARYRSIVENTTDLIATLSLDGNFIYASPNYAHTLGYKPSELVGQPWAPLIHPADLDELQHFAERLTQTDISMVSPQYRVKTSHGDWRWYVSAASCVRDGSGAPLYLVSIARDISDRIQTEDTLRHAKEEAESANQAKSSFLRTMSHELRTPLNGILGFARSLQKTPHLPPNHYNGLRVIESSGEHLLMLIEELLDFSKIEAQKMELYPITFNLVDILDSISAFFHPRAQQKDIAFHVELAPSVPTAVWGDAQRLRQVLINLIGNAIKFTERGHVILRVMASPFPLVPAVYSSSGGYSSNGHTTTPPGVYPGNEPSYSGPADPFASTVRFQVEDTGIGIASHNIEAIFQPFQQIRNARQPQDGTGLGLAISQKLIEMMGGTLQVQSVTGEGSVFWFDLRLPSVAEAMMNDGATDGHGWQPQDNRRDDLTDDLTDNGQTAHSREAMAHSLDSTVISSSSDNISSNVLLFPEEGAIATLKNLARIGDIQGILTYVDKLEQHEPSLKPFANTIRQRAKFFQVRKIREFLDTVSPPSLR